MTKIAECEGSNASPTYHFISLAEDVVIPADSWDPEVTLFADETRVVMRAAGVERTGTAVGRVAHGGGKQPARYQLVDWDGGGRDAVDARVLHRAPDVVAPALPEGACGAGESSPSGRQWCSEVAGHTAHVRHRNAVTGYSWSAMVQATESGPVADQPVLWGLEGAA